jgi:aminoglycoside phosphotransferase (APT) family kinase protein
MAAGAFELSLERAQAVLDAYDGSRARAVRPLAGGSTDVFAIAREGAPDVALKAYADQPAWKPAKEAAVARMMHGRLSVPAPDWLKVDETRAVLPRAYALMSLIEGETMRARFGLPEAPGLYRAMGALLRKVHGVAMPAFGYIDAEGGLFEPRETNRAYIEDKMVEKFAHFAGLGGDPGLLKRVERRSAALTPLLDVSVKPVLCHFDFHPGNVLAARADDGAWRLSGLIDFENALAGDPLFDLAKALDYTTHEDAAGRAPLLEGYGALGRSDAEPAILFYRLYHKLELWNFFRFLNIQPEGCAALLDDVEKMV